MRFFASQHVRSNTDFLKIKAGGQRESVGAFAIQMIIPSCASEDQKELRRFGVIASRRVGIAVKRNRAKRIFREIFRLNQAILPPSCDLILVAYANFDKYSFVELQERYQSGILKVMRKLNANQS